MACVVYRVLCLMFQAFMACVWFVETLLLLILYTDLHIIKEEEKENENSVQAASVPKTEYPDYATYSTNEDLQYDSIDQTVTENLSQNGYIQKDNSDQYKQNDYHNNNKHTEHKTKQKLTWQFFKKGMYIYVKLTLIFISCFLKREY